MRVKCKYVGFTTHQHQKRVSTLIPHPDTGSHSYVMLEMRVLQFHAEPSDEFPSGSISIGTTDKKTWDGLSPEPGKEYWVDITAA